MDLYLSHKRIVELDFFRGLAVILMAFQHFIFDLRHVFGLNIFGFQDTVYFMDWFRPIIVYLFLVVSGASSTFSQNNLRRGLKLLALALGLTFGLELINLIFESNLHIFFNVFHLLAIGILFYHFLSKNERESKIPYDWRALVLILLALVFMYLGVGVERQNPISHNWLLPLGLYSYQRPPMLDYMPLIPWFGFFLAGGAIGRMFYRQRRSLLRPREHRALARVKPILFLGRHALVFYFVHQVVFLVILWVALTLMGRI